MLQVKPLDRRGVPDWVRMRERLWPSEPGEHAREAEAHFGGTRRDPVEVFLAFDEAGRAVGFAEVSLRSHAEGCDSSPVAYLEGWFVEEDCRRQGVGRALVEAIETWGRSHGCSELASDTEIHNTASAAAHGRLGFEEVDRIVCFRKPI